MTLSNKVSGHVVGSEHKQTMTEDCTDYEKGECLGSVQKSISPGDNVISDVSITGGAKCADLEHVSTDKFLTDDSSLCGEAEMSSASDMTDNDQVQEIPLLYSEGNVIEKNVVIDKTEIHTHDDLETDSVYTKFKKNINDRTRNRSYKKFITAKRNDEQLMLGLTDDLIIEMNVDTLAVEINNPTRCNFASLLDMVLEARMLPLVKYAKEVKMFRLALPGIVEDQQLKSED